MKSPGPEAMIHLLVIGYGNVLRSDDGAGPRVADSMEALGLHGVKTISCPLLTPELAEPISQARVAVFVDAAVDPPLEVRLRQIEPAASAQIIAHAADPRTLLALAKEVFGHAPRSWWLTVPAQNLDIGDKLSPLTQRGMLEAVRELRNILSEQSEP